MIRLLVPCLTTLALASCGSTTSPAATPGTTARAACPEHVAPPQDSQRSSPPNVRVAACSVDWLPPGVVRDVPTEQTDELAVLVREWLAPRPRVAPRIDLQGGIVFAKSADDSGADPPHPRSTAATGEHVCGLHAVWLRAHLRSTFALAASHDADAVRCHQNVCCVPGMEYVSDRAIVFRRVESEGAPAFWVIDSAYEVAEASLRDDVVTANRRDVAGRLARHAESTCAGEPPGYR